MGITFVQLRCCILRAEYKINLLIFLKAFFFRNGSGLLAILFLFWRDQKPESVSIVRDRNVLESVNILNASIAIVIAVTIECFVCLLAGTTTTTTVNGRYGVE